MWPEKKKKKLQDVIICFQTVKRDMADFETVSKSGFDRLWGLKMYPEKY